LPDNGAPRAASDREERMTQCTLVLAQINTLVGDFEGNAAQVVARIQAATAQDPAAIIVFPELTLSGYPPEDLLLRASVEVRVERALDTVRAAVGEAHVVLGYPRRAACGALYNAAGVLHRGELIAEYHKQCLPNYQVFDEKRYFQAGTEACVLPIAGIPTAITICEDVWDGMPVAQAAAAGARLLLNLNASPYHLGKQGERLAVVRARAIEHGLVIAYVNQVGGQDELVFDGGSFVLDATGNCALSLPSCTESVAAVIIEQHGTVLELRGGVTAPALGKLAATYEALVLGVRDYVDKNRFPGVVLGLSGGIDSALTLALAVDALGPERVEAVMMPFRYTAAMSIEDAASQAALLGVHYRTIPIEPVYAAFMAVLTDEFAGRDADTTEENLQARCRGVILMSISNKKNLLVLTTGNKSELAVGYSTLYGDMAGGFDILKDVPKTLVYALAHFRNERAPAIPVRVIERPPSAELAPGQTDQDSLPPYDILDQILELYVEEDCSLEAIVARGFERDTVSRVIGLVDRNEYKRRQAPVGVRITRRGFGRDRRYPITSGWRPGH